MAQEAGRKAEADSPKSAARFVRRRAATIRESGARIGQHRAEYLALIEWARLHILRDGNGDLVAIDLIIGPPGDNLRRAIDEFQNGPLLPF